MAVGARERCGRCGADPSSAGEPYTCWIWTASEVGLEEHALQLCAPCALGFASNEERAEYLRIGFYWR